MKRAGFAMVFGFALTLGAAGGYLLAPAMAQAPEGFWNMTEAEYLASFPADVYPESRARVPIVDRATLDPVRQIDFDEHISPETTSLAGIYGPGGVRLHGSHEGTEGEELGGRLRELIRLVVSREMDQAFEWEAHEPVALRFGLEPEIIDVIRYDRDLANVPEREAAIIQLGREYFQTHRVSSETYARVRDAIGIQNLVDMCVLMGDYVETAILLTVNDVHVEYGTPYILPVP
jgi:4-carboxymuconolactone decarboxylase